MPAFRRAVFFDRDGVLNEERGYVCVVEELHVYPHAAEAVRHVNQSGWLAILITNQAAIARGLLDEDMLTRIHAQLAAELARGGARLDAIYYCPHHPEQGHPPYRSECECRKPRPGMLRRAAREHGLHLADCWLVTDRQSEVEMMQAEGGRAALVLTGYGERDWQGRGAGSRAPNLIATGVLPAIEALLAEPSPAPSSPPCAPDARLA